MNYRATFLLGGAFVAAAALGVVVFAVHVMIWERDFTLLDEPMQVVANRTITDAFTIPISAPYEIRVYVQARVPYADCLLGQGGERCSLYRRAIDVVWLVHDKDGGVLRESASELACCDYTADRYKNPVVFATIGTFRLPAGTTAYIELRHRRDVSKLQSIRPRIVVERSDPEESEMGIEVWSLVGIAALLVVGLVLVTTAWALYRRTVKR